MNDYLNQATADASGRPVRTGPVEATALSNAIVQAVAAGRFRTVEARGHVAAAVSAARSSRARPRPATWAPAGGGGRVRTLAVGLLLAAVPAGAAPS